MKTKKIKLSDLKVGDKIKSLCPVTNKIVYKSVTNVWNTLVQKENQVQLIFQNGSIINCSVDHPIMILTDNGINEKYPLDLTIDDDVIVSNGTTTNIKAINLDQANDTKYIDISVEDTSIFFASSGVNEEMILTHNCSQGGVRKGSATLNYPIWHHDFESLVVLKNNRGTEDNRARHVDYCVHLNKLFIERLISGGEITFFSPDVKNGELYELFYKDQKAFKKLYEKLEQDDSIRKKVKPALEVFSTLLTERAQTGRIYLFNTDHVNSHSNYKSLIYMTNLCTEVNIPTFPLEKDGSGEIALCTLAAFNVGAIEDLNEYEELSELIVEALDNLLDYQDYPLEAARVGGQDRRALGVGIINYAHWLAKNGARYSDGSGNDMTHQLFETISFYLHKASIKLAKERGACKLYDETKYSDGILLIDTYKKEIDDKVTVGLEHDWESLREDLKKYGIRNSSLMTLMPAETSSAVTNSTNGIEPPRKYVQYKDSKDGIIKQVLPDIKNLFADYELAWEIKDNTGYLTLTGIMQKFVDQAISVNSYYNPINYEGGKVPLQVLIKDLITWYSLGNKTAYYHNTNDGNDEEDEGCEGGACKL
jgi:ribonucleoside-diphosphate reductase alpha chain